MKNKTMLIVFLIIASYISFSISSSFAEDSSEYPLYKEYNPDDHKHYASLEDFQKDTIKDGKFIKHKDTDISAYDIDEFGGTVVSSTEVSTEVSIQKIGFKYKSYNAFIINPYDDKPSIILIFNRGSIKSTIYMDKKAKEILESGGNIEIVTKGSASSPFIADKSITTTDTSGIFAVEIKDKNDKTDLTEAIVNELKTGSKVVYPKISGSDSVIVGSEVIIKDPSLSSIKNFKDLILWINLQFDTNLDNKEKKILKDGILLTLEKTVEDATAPAPDVTLSPEEPVINVCPVDDGIEPA